MSMAAIAGSCCPQIQREREVSIHRHRRGRIILLRRAVRDKSSQSSALGLIGVDWKTGIISSAGMRDVILAPAQRSTVPGVVEVDNQRRLDADSWLETDGGLPGAEPDAGDTFAVDACAMQRHSPSVHSDGETIVHESACLELEAFEGAVDVTHGAAGGAFLAED